jgi:hypothetical protein
MLGLIGYLPKLLTTNVEKEHLKMYAKGTDIPITMLNKDKHMAKSKIKKISTLNI